jgi:D-glycero-alpha-D-manno-heptose-7-phosphate kinase
MVNRDQDDPGPLTVVRAVAPVRICDLGGWTDTWFAGRGKVFNIGVSPTVETSVEVHAIGTVPDRIALHVDNYGEHYSFEPGHGPQRHALLEAVVEEVGLPDGVSVVIRIASQVPPGAATGTSAATAVTLMGALDALTPGRLSPRQVAEAAHRVEVDRLGLQSGVQDQMCAAFGGVNYLEIDTYPRAAVSRVAVPPPIWDELDARLLLLYLGSSHASSAMHDRVIARLLREGQDSPQLEDLRRCAEGGRDAVRAGDLEGLGRLMIENTEAQARLHEDLVSEEARRAIDVASAHGSTGWKVNGAGGEGGSLTILWGADRAGREEMERALLDADTRFRLIPIRLSRDGLVVRGPN